jgi:hypothetical protein
MDAKTSEAERLSRARVARRRRRASPLDSRSASEKNASMKSTALSAEGALHWRRGVAALGLRTRACAALTPRRPRNRRRQFLSNNQTSRYIESRARSAGRRWAARRGRDHADIWRKRESGSTDRQPLDFPRNGQGKKFGNPWKSLEKLGISMEFPWKSLEILEKAWGAAL